MKKSYKKILIIFWIVFFMISIILYFILINFVYGGNQIFFPQCSPNLLNQSISDYSGTVDEDYFKSIFEEEIKSKLEENHTTYKSLSFDYDFHSNYYDCIVNLNNEKRTYSFLLKTKNTL